jgi:hypothetical protein
MRHGMICVFLKLATPSHRNSGLSQYNSMLYTNIHKIKRTHRYNLRIRYIKFVGNIKKWQYCYKFEIKYRGKIVPTDPFNYTVVVVHDLPRRFRSRRRAIHIGVLPRYSCVYTQL